MKTNRWVRYGLAAVAVAAAYVAGRTSATSFQGAARDAVGDAPGAETAGDGEIRLGEAALQRFGLRLARVEARDVAGEIAATGTVGADETRVARLRAFSRGRVDAVYVRLGDRVRAGQRLLSHDNPELGDAIGEYLAGLAAVEKAATEAEVGRRSLERARKLAGLGAIARAELDRRDAEYRNALASAESLKAVAAKFEEQLHRFGMTDEEIGKLKLGSSYHREASHTVVTAPLVGLVVESPPVAGMWFNAGDPLVTIADLSTVWVQAGVYEKDIAGVRPGAAVRITSGAYPGRSFPGRVTYVGDSLDAQTRTAKVRCEAANPEGLLKLDMFVDVRIAAGGTRRALVVPAEAVQRIEEETVVFVPSGAGTYRRRDVRLGQTGEGWAEVTGGLRAGEPVVAEGSFLLKSELRKAELGGHEH